MKKLIKIINKYKKVLIVTLLILINVTYFIYWWYAIYKKITFDCLQNAFVYSSYGIIFLLFFPQNKDSFKKYKEAIILFIYFFILELLFVLNTKLDYTSLFFVSTIFILYVLYLLFSYLPIKLKQVLINILMIFFPIYLIIQTIYMAIFNEFFSIVEVFTLKEGMDFAAGVIEFNFIYVIYIIILIIGLIIFNKNKNKVKKVFNYKSLVVPLMIFLLLIYNMQIPVKQARLHTSDKYLYKNVYSHKRFIARFGVTNYIIRDLVKFGQLFFQPKINYDKEIDKYFKNNPKVHLENEYTGLFEGKNLIFIMAESLDDIAINKTLTPNIYKLQNEGWNFENHFIPVYPRTTCDSEIIYNTSIIPSITDGPTCYTFNTNSYHNSLANIFRNEGYLTQAFHSNAKEFYTRNLVYKGLGYDYFYDQKDLNLTDVDKRYDTIFFDKGRDYFTNLEQKFMSFIITLSGHSPYDQTNLAVKKHYQKVKTYFDKSKIKADDKIISYIATQIELDLFIKKLLEDLEKKELLEKTVIILTADHYPYTIGKKVYEKYTKVTDEYLKNKGVLIIWTKDITSIKFEELTQSFDLLPTISNLFNLKTDYTNYFGYDIFDSNRLKITYFKDYSWFDGDNYVKYQDQVVGSAKVEYINKISKRINDYYDISIKILRSNYFKN